MEIESCEEIATTIFDHRKYALIMTLLISLGTILSVYLAVQLHNIIVIFIGLFLFAVCPTLIFRKKIKEKFTKDGIVHLNNSSINIDIYSTEISQDKISICYSLESIKSFKTILPVNDDTLFLKLNFKNGNKIVYAFYDQQKKEIINECINRYIIKYNEQNEGAEKIYLIPNLFASKIGGYYIIALTFVLLMVLTYQILFQNKTIPYTLFLGIFLYVQIIVQRKKDKNNLDNFNGN